MKNKKLIIGLGILAVAGIGYYMWKNKKSAKSRVSNSDVKSVTPPSEMGATNTDENSESYEIEGGGGTPNCITTCESTPSNPNQAPTVYAGACSPNLANQPYGGYHTITRCGGAVKSVPVKMNYKNYREI